MGRAPLRCKSPSLERRGVYTRKKAAKTRQGRAACSALGGLGSKLYALGVDETQGEPAPEYITIDHPWFANDTIPIYRWTFPSEATDEELRTSFREREALAARVCYPMAWVIDLSNITKAPATQRKALAAHLERFGQLSARWYAGAAVIVPSPWLRGIATAVTWLWPPKFPYELFSEPLDAEHWAKKQLATKLAQLG